MWPIVRASFVLGALIAAAYFSPLRGSSPDEDALPAATPSPTIPPNLRTSVDERLLREGTSHALVGSAAPEIGFSTFDDVTVNLTTGSRPAIVTFFDGACAGCDDEVQKLAVASTILFDKAWIGALVAPEGADAFETAVVNGGADDLIFAGVDAETELAERFEVASYPTTVVIGAGGEIVAVWDQPIPVGLLLRFMRDLVPAS